MRAGRAILGVARARADESLGAKRRHNQPMAEGRFKSVREFVTVLATLKRMEDADSVSEEYKPGEVYSLTNRSRRLGRRALELASRNEAQDPEGAHELRAMAGRHRQDLRRAARAIA